MNSVIGIIFGVAVTVIVARYYFRRTTQKRLTLYRVLNTRIFAGIDEEVRKQLRFTFREEEVSELQQIEFLVANDGEQAVSNLIDPLCLDLPTGIKVLDASILHRSPKNLQCSVRTTTQEDGIMRIVLDFPLLNKGEYFLVKLLISGTVPTDELSFTILADDLPRTLKFRWLSYDALQERKVRVEWPALVIGILLLGSTCAMGFALYSLVRHQPDLFPYPWSTFKFSVTLFLVMLPSCVGLLLLGIFGIFLTIGMAFEGLFPGRGPRFPLPEEFRRRSFHFRDIIHEAHFRPLPPPNKQEEEPSKEKES